MSTKTTGAESLTSDSGATTAARKATASLRIWVDITNAPHVLVLLPIISRLKDRGHDVVITARDFSQTVSLLERKGIQFQEIGAHRGRKVAAKVLGLASRTTSLFKLAKRGNFDLALSHGSNDMAISAYLLGIPHVTMFDYEHARIAHHINLRLASRILTPELVPTSALTRFGARRKVIHYPGLKEQYYLTDWQTDPSELERLGVDSSKVIVVIRTPPDAALYHRFENSLFSRLLDHLGKAKDLQFILLPRTPEQRATLSRMNLKNAIIPERAVDAQTLIYYADVVISAGGTMNREATCLNTPVYTIFEGKLGAIDAHLIKEGKLIRLENLEDLKLEKKRAGSAPQTRDPEFLVAKILEVVE